MIDHFLVHNLQNIKQTYIYIYSYNMIIVNDSHSYFIRHHTLYVREIFKLLFYCKQILQNG